jgi:hypothetical protein
MEDTERKEAIVPESPEKKIKRWDHIAVRPSTFEEFRRLRSSNYTSDDAFIRWLLNPAKAYVQDVKNIQNEKKETASVPN